MGLLTRSPLHPKTPHAPLSNGYWMLVWATYAVNFLLTSAVDAARADDGTPPPMATAPRSAAPKVLSASDREHAPSCAALMTTLLPSESGQGSKKKVDNS